MTVVVTGGASGRDVYMVYLLAKESASTVGVGINLGGAAGAVTNIEREGGTYICINSYVDEPNS